MWMRASPLHNQLLNFVEVEGEVVFLAKLPSLSKHFMKTENEMEKKLLVSKNSKRKSGACI
jgi:hypothetical protein